jgi:hypothetical protein
MKAGGPEGLSATALPPAKVVRQSDFLLAARAFKVLLCYLTARPLNSEPKIIIIP